MVAIVAGQGLGLLNTSLGLLGSAGQLGEAGVGRSGERVSVNAATGNLVVQQQDEWLVGIGADPEVLRTYNSRGAGTDDNGDNWRLGLSRRITGLTGTIDTVGSSVKLIGEDGAEVIYTWDAGRSLYVTKDGAGAFDTLSYNTGTSRWTWIDGDTGIQDIYETVGGSMDGRLVLVKGRDGNLIRLLYAGSTPYQFTSILTMSPTSSSGDKITITYDGTTGDILSTTTTYWVAGYLQPAVKRVSYSYETYGANLRRLKSVTVDLTPQNASDNATAGTTYVTTYGYVGSTNQLAGITQSDGSKLEFGYDGSGRINLVKETVGGQLRQTTLDYSVTGKTVLTDALGQVTELIYETTVGQNQNQLKAIRSLNGGNVLQERSFQYDASGNVSQVTDGRGNSTSFRYDANGNRVYERDAKGNVARRTYSSTNQLLTQTSYRDLDPDGVGAGEPSQSQTVRYVYETAAGKEYQLRFAISAEGRVTEKRYNNLGQLTSTLSYPSATYNVTALAVNALPALADVVSWAAEQPKTALQRVDYTYNTRGQLDKQTSYATVDANGAGVRADNSHSETQYVYDQAGNLLQKIDGRGNATVYQYDGLNRVTSVKDAASQQTTVTTYQDSSLQTQVTALNGVTTISTSDASGRVISVARSHPDTGALGTTTYTYDKLGRLTSTTLPTGEVSYIVYDTLGRKVGEVDASGALVEHQYNGNNQLTRTVGYGSLLASAALQTLASNVATQTVTALSAIRPTANSVLDRSQWSLYDKAGQLVMTVTASTDGLDPTSLRGAVQAYSYDGAGRLIETQQYATLLSAAQMGYLSSAASELQASGNQITAGAQLIALTEDNGKDRIVRRYYDHDGRLVGQLGAEGHYVGYTYDAAGQLVRTSAYARAAAGTLGNDHQPPSLIAEGAAYPSGAYIESFSGADQHSYIIYNARGEVAAKVDAEGYATTYQYDAAGNKAQETLYYTASSASNSANAISLGRIVLPDGGGAERYVTAHANDRKTSYQYDPDNRLKRTEVQPSGLITDYTYDPKTGLLTQTTAAVAAGLEERSTQQRYDKLGRLTQELTGEGVKALLALAANATNGDIDAIWSQYGVRHEYDQGGHRLATITPNGTDGAGIKTAYYYDQSGRVVYSINALGEVSSYAYNAFGDLLNERRHSKRLASLNGVAGGLQKNMSAQLVSAIAETLDPDADRSLAYGYDRAGRRVKMLDGIGSLSEYGYSVFNELTSTARAAAEGGSSQLVTLNEYDRRGLLSSVIEEDEMGNSLRLRSGTFRDAFGRVIEAFDSNFQLRTYTYDRMGRQVYASEPGAFMLGTSTSYDAFGRTLTIAEPNGQSTTFTYDDAARTMTTVIPVAWSPSTQGSTPESLTLVTQFSRHGQIVSLINGKGEKTQYAYDKNGQLTSRSVRNEAGALEEGSSERTYYDKAGRVQKTVAGNGNTTLITYDAANRVLTKVDGDVGAQRTLEYRYDALGNVVWSKDANGVWSATSYNQRGQVTSIVIDPLAVPDGSAGSGASASNTFSTVANPRGSQALHQTTDFLYTLDGFLQFVVKGGLDMVYPQTTEYTYDKLGRRIKEVVDPGAVNLDIDTSYVYDENDNVVARKDAMGQVTRFVYDEGNRMTFKVDAMGAVTRYSYDELGNISRTIAYAQRISLVGLGDGVNQYTVLARLPAQLQPGDQVSYNFYDPDGRLIASMDALGYLTQRVYDKAGNVLRVVRYANRVQQGDTTGSGEDGRLSFVVPKVYSPADFSNNPPTVGQPYVLADGQHDQVDQYMHDALGRVTWYVDALGHATQTEYTLDGNLVTQTRYANKLVYPSGNMLAEGVAPLVLGVAPGITTQAYVLVLDDSQQRQSHQAYDALGRNIYSIDALGYVTDRAFNAAGQLIKETRYAIAEDWDESNPDNAVTAYEYDAAGRRTKMTDAEGVVTTYQYDELGYLSDTTVAAGTSEASTTHYRNDLVGNVIEETRGHGSSEASSTRYVLNALGQREKVIDPRGVQLVTYNLLDSDHSAVGEWVRSERLRLVQSALNPTEGSAACNSMLQGYTTTQIFDAQGRVTKITNPLNASTLTEYDAFGNAIKVTDPNGNAGYFFFDQGNQLVFQVDPRGYAIETRYDGFGNASSVVRYYNQVKGTIGAGKAPTVLVEQPANPPTGAYLVKTAGLDSGFGFVYGGDATTLIEHDALNRQIAITDASGQTERIEYGDGFGNKTALINKAGGVTSYSYDKLDRQTGVTQPEQVKQFDVDGRVKLNSQGTVDTALVETRYEYDAFGNRTKMMEAYGLPSQRTTSYTYDKMHRLLATTQQSTLAYTVEKGGFTGVPVEQRRYDLRGNLVEVADASGARTLTWWDRSDRRIAELTASGGTAGGAQVGSLVTFEYSGADMVARRAWGQSLALPSSWTTEAKPVPASAEGRTTHFLYDAAHRLTQSTIKGIVAGDVSATSGNFTLGAIDLVTKTEYDANGNAVVETDARGAKTYHYYDQVGNRVASVDGNRYATFWARDASGNVTTELKTARQLPEQYDLTRNLDVQVLANLTASMLDRGMLQYRDVLGRVVISTVFNAPVYDPLAVDESARYKAANESSYPVTRYEYNALGKVVKRTEITGEVSEWGYDKQGRETSRLGSIFNDYLGHAVRSVTDTEYDALGQIQRSIQRGTDSLSESDDRITLFRYGINGLLASKVDASGAVTQYEYDLAGHLTRSSTARLDAMDSLNRQPNMQPGSLLVERGGSSHFAQNLSTFVYGVGMVFSAEVMLGTNGVGRNFEVGLSGGVYSHGAVFNGSSLSAAIKAQVTTQPASATVVLKDNTLYVTEIRVTKHAASGNFISTLYVYEKGRAYDSGFVDVRTVGTTAWTGLSAGVKNNSAALASNSAGLGVTDAIDNLMLRDGLAAVAKSDFGVWQDHESQITAPQSTGKTLTVYDAMGRTRRSLVDAEEYSYDAAGREIRRHSYTINSLTAPGAYAINAGQGNGVLAIDRSTSSDPTFLNGVETVKWASQTRFSAEFTVGDNFDSQDVKIGIVDRDNFSGSIQPADQLRLVAARFKQGRCGIWFAGGQLWNYSVLDFSVVPGRTYTIEIVVQYAYGGESDVRLKVRPKEWGYSSSDEADWLVHTNFQLVGDARVYIENGGVSTGFGGDIYNKIDKIDKISLSDKYGGLVLEDFSRRGDIQNHFKQDDGAGTRSVWIQDAAGASDKANSVTSEIRYNAYGEVIAKGRDEGWQESAQYDAAGRVIRSVGADGAPRIYVYDANGNISLTLMPPADGQTSAVVKQIFDAGTYITSGDIKTLLSNSARVLISAHDARNQLTDTYEASSTKLFASLNQVNSTVGSVYAEEVKSYAPAASVATGKSLATSFSYVSDLYSTWTGGKSGNDRNLQSLTDTFQINIARTGVIGQKYRVVVDVDNGHIPRHGKGYVEGTHQVMDLVEESGTGLLSKSITFNRYPRNGYWSDYGDVSGAGVRVYVYRLDGATGATELVAAMGGELPRTGLPPYFSWLHGPTYHQYLSAGGNTNTVETKSLTAAKLPEGASRAVLQYRLSEQAPAAWRTAAVTIQNGTAVFGESLLRAMGSGAIGTVEKPLEYVLSTMDAAGHVLSVQSGEVGVSRDAAATNYYYGLIIKAPSTVEDRTGRLFTSDQGVMFVAATAGASGPSAAAANSAVVRFRKVGEEGWSSSQTVNATSINGLNLPGWFKLSPPGLFLSGTTYEYRIDMKDGVDGQGQLVEALSGYMKAAGGSNAAGSYQVYEGAAPVKADRSPTIVRFQDVPVEAASLTLSYTLTKRVWTDALGAPLAQGRLVVERQGSVTLTKNSEGKYVWDAAVVGLDPALQYTLDYTLTVKDGANAVLSTLTSREALRTGNSKPVFDAVIYSPSAASTQLFRVSSSKIKITPANDIAKSVRKAVLSYRVAGSGGAYTDITVIPTPDALGVVSEVTFDLTSQLVAGADFTDFDVYYRYEDGSGNVLLGYTSAGKEDVGGATRFTPILVRAMADQTFVSGASDVSTVLWGFANAPTTSHRRQGYNAFGEVAFEVSSANYERARKKKAALGRELTAAEFATYASWMHYDGMGRLSVKIEPEATATLENGYQVRQAAATTYQYDSLGRMVSMKDARGNVVQYDVLKTGDARRAVLNELQPNDAGGSYHAIKYGYDVFGDLRAKTTPLAGNSTALTEYAYDKMGRLIKADMPVGNAGKRATHLYSYDSKGNRILHRTSADDVLDAVTGLGANEITEYTVYDVEGRVRKTVSGTGLTTSTFYAFAGAGQRVKIHTDENGKTVKDWMDYGGRVLFHTDMSGNRFRYDYNLAGNLIAQYQVDSQNAKMAGKQDITYEYWSDGTLKRIKDNTLNAISYFEYDNDGNRTLESYTINNENLQTSTISYDELGRIAEVADPRYYKLTYEYDQVGNRRRVFSNKVGAAGSVDYWYTYDSQNRMLISMGQLLDGRSTIENSASRISQGAAGRGVKLSYDIAGNRASALYAGQSNAELYSYTADGYLTTVTKGGQQISQRTNDLLGRVTTYVQNNADGVVTETRQYDKDNRVTYTKNIKAGSATVETWNSYSSIGPSVRASGLLYSTKTITTPTSGGATTSYTRYDYVFRDSALQSGIRVGATNPDISPTWGTWAQGVSQFTYDINGHLMSVTDSKDGTDTNVRQINFTVNADGLIMRRDETGQFSVAPFQRYFYVDGRRVVEWANVEIPNSVSYAEALVAPPADDPNPRNRYRNIGPIRSDIDQNYAPISASYPAFTPGGYTVRSGDTLEGIARSVWGDATMWYLIADANGLMTNANLRVGQLLVIPNKVTNFHNTSQTTRVYNPGELMGDVSPTLPEAPVPPPPPEGGGCGGAGMVLMVVVAIVVSVVTAGAALTVLAPGFTSVAAAVAAGGWATVGGLAAAAVGAAAGSIASQAVGMATGNIQSFSWSAVGRSAVMGAISAGATAAANATGLYAIDKLGSATSSWGAMGQAAISNTITQGVAVATGMQSKFSWTAVAASAAGAGAAFGAGEALGALGAGFGGGMSKDLVYGTVRGLASGWASSEVRHERPDWGTIALNSFGSALGDAVVGKIVEVERERANAKWQSEVDYILGDDINPAPVAGTKDWGGFTRDRQARAASAKTTGQMIDEYFDNKPLSDATGDTSPSRVYVQDGDSLTELAKRWPVDGVSVNDRKNQWIAANPQLANPNALSIGQELNYPGANTVVGSAALQRAVGADAEYQAQRQAMAAQQATVANQGTEPVWSFREASRAQIAADQAAKIDAGAQIAARSRANAPSALAWDGKDYLSKADQLAFNVDSIRNAGPVGIAGGTIAYAASGGNVNAYVAAANDAQSIDGALGAVSGLGTRRSTGGQPAKLTDPQLLWEVPIAATQKFPSSWGAGELNNKGVGIRWQDPKNLGNGVRIDQGNPNNSQVVQQVDHVVVRSNGKVIGADGRPIGGSIKQNHEAAHIPLSDYVKWKKWNSPS